MVKYMRSSAGRVPTRWLRRYSFCSRRLEIADLPSCDAFARASYAKMVELKLRDAPRLGSLPEYDATRDFKADAKQRSIAASDSAMRHWDEQRRLKAEVSRGTVKLDFSPFAPRTLLFGVEHAQG